MSCHPKNAPRNAEIIRRRKAGEWPSEIWRSMGLGRNVVIGVCNRAGLAHADTDKTEPRRKYAPRGEANGLAKLTAAAVAGIRDFYKPGKFGGNHSPNVGKVRLLAARFGVSEGVIYRAASGRTWA